MDISVIIPSYKPEDYIKDCLFSLNSQTLNKNLYEILIILNGCKEPWLQNLKDFLSSNNFHNVRVLHTDTGGVSNARNIGIEKSVGDYIAFVDDDDFVSPTYLEDLLRVSTSNCVGLADSIYIDDETKHLKYDNIHHKEYWKLKDLENPSLFQARRFFNGPVMKLIHRDIIGNCRFDCRFSNGEDSLFMALISDRIIQCKFCPQDAVYYRRIRLNSATTSKRTLIMRCSNSVKKIIQYIKYWVKHPFRYNAPFMISRILASLKTFFIG